jgi:hypothetical protein
MEQVMTDERLRELEAAMVEELSTLNIGTTESVFRQVLNRNQSQRVVSRLMVLIRKSMQEEM